MKAKPPKGAFFTWRGVRRPHVPLSDEWRPTTPVPFRRFVQVSSETHAKVAAIAFQHGVTIKTALEVVLRGLTDRKAAQR